MASARSSRVRNLEERITVTVRTFAFSLDIETTSFKIRDTRKIIDLFSLYGNIYGCVCVCDACAYNFFLLIIGEAGERLKERISESVHS